VNKAAEEGSGQLQGECERQLAALSAELAERQADHKHQIRKLTAQHQQHVHRLEADAEDSFRNNSSIGPPGDEDGDGTGIEKLKS
jgi:hypothetical protein